MEARSLPMKMAKVVVLSADGTTYEVLATRGEGPGEVTFPYTVLVLGQDSVLVPDSRQSRLTLFVGGAVASMVSLPRAAHFGVAGIGSSGELLLWNRFPSRLWIDIEEEWLAGHMTLFDTETGALDTVASYDHYHGERSGVEGPIIRPIGEVTAAAGRFRPNEVRQARDHLASAGRHGNPDRALAARAQPADRGTPGARRSL